jgi:uncharacterized membrane protein
MSHGRSSPTEIAQTRTSREWAPPRWASPTALLLACGGLGVSVYLTIAHYGSNVTLACPDTGVINCEKVTTSPQSVIFEVPVAVLGLAFFAAMVVMNLPRVRRCPGSFVRSARIGLAAFGVAFAVYLVYTELFTIHAICLWCTSAHVMAFLLFVVALFAETLGRPSAVASRPPFGAGVHGGSPRW